MIFKRIPKKFTLKQALIGLAVLAPCSLLVGVLVGRFSLTSAPTENDLQKLIGEQARLEEQRLAKELADLPILSHKDLKETGDLHIANQDRVEDKPEKIKPKAQKKSLAKKAIKPPKEKAKRSQPASRTTPFSIQVGAFEQMNHALDLVARLKQAGFKARIGKKSGRDDRTWYTVNIGWYRSRQELGLVLKKLKAAGIKKPLVVQIK